jgi:hypothetical protein
MALFVKSILYPISWYAFQHFRHLICTSLADGLLLYVTLISLLEKCGKVTGAE